MDPTSHPLPLVAANPATVLSDDQRALLRAILNRIVPVNGALAGAGDLGVGESVEQALVAAPARRRTFVDGLLAIELAASRRDADFTALSADEQDAILHEIAATHAAFLNALVEHTYRGYYLLPDVHAAIGYESRPPHPLGYDLPPFDESLLAQQRQRQPFWRRTG